MATYVGTSGAETLQGTIADDTFDALGGNDVLIDRGGNNTIVINFGYGRDGYQMLGSTGVRVVYSGSIQEVATIRDIFVSYLPFIPETYALRELYLYDGTVLVPYGDPAFTRPFDQLQTADANGHVLVFSGTGATVDGTGANEIFGGSEIAQTINAGDGDDIVFANAGADTVNAGEGNDYVSAGLEWTIDNDQFFGGNGIDTISYSGMSGGVQVNLTAGVASGALVGTDVISSFEVAVGSLGDDVLIGTNDHNTLTGLFGNDYFYGYGGNDLMRGDTGIDVLIGDSGDDVLFGGHDTDYLFGGDGSDTLDGGEGADVLNDLNADGIGGVFFGGGGGDFIYAGSGADTAYGGDGNDIFVMANGSGDVVHGDAGQDYFYLGDGADQVFGGAGVDVILAAGGSDVIDAGADVDYLWLGSGADQVVLRPGYSAEVVNEFSVAQDKIRFEGTGLSSFAGVLANTSDFGGYSIISLPDGSASVWLIGVSSSQLSAANVLFA
jgi:Ca2+-binding RTX toxin-like protein